MSFRTVSEVVYGFEKTIRCRGHLCCFRYIIGSKCPPVQRSAKLRHAQCKRGGAGPTDVDQNVIKLGSS